jgi:hypothetical protein
MRWIAIAISEGSTVRRLSWGTPSPNLDWLSLDTSPGFMPGQTLRACAGFEWHQMAVNRRS